MEEVLGWSEMIDDCPVWKLVKPVDEFRRTDILRKATEAAYGDGEDSLEETFVAEPLCNICLFLLNDPIKRDKPRAYCTTRCGQLVHQPSLDKSGCNSEKCKKQ